MDELLRSGYWAVFVAAVTLGGSVQQQWVRRSFREF